MKRILLLATAMAVVTPALVPTMAGAEPAVAATTCLGKPVTIVASLDVKVGTEGDDVVAMTPSGWSTFDALGGNDTICLALGMRPSTTPVTSTPPDGVDSTADDVVVNEATAAPGARMSVGLGAGDDTFTGNNTPAHGVRRLRRPCTGCPTPPPAGGQLDQIDMGPGRRLDPPRWHRPVP